MFAPKYRPLVHKLLLLALLVLPAGCGLADDYGSVVKLIELFTRVKAAKVDYEICLVRDAKQYPSVTLPGHEGAAREPLMLRQPTPGSRGAKQKFRGDRA